MNNKVNNVFLDSNKELLTSDKIVLESDEGITNDEKIILESIFDKIRENNLENMPIKFSLDKYAKDTLINLQNKKVIIINIEKKESVLTQWYSIICNTGDNEATIFIDNIVFEYLRLFVLNKKAEV